MTADEQNRGLRGGSERVARVSSGQIPRGQWGQS